MAISVGAYTFDAGTTVVREAFEAVGGKQTRAIQITGVLRGLADLAALNAALDDVLNAASEETPVYVSLREGRRLLARREGFSREVNARAPAGQFTLDLRAEAALEESDTVHTVAWSTAVSGAEIAVSNAGNAAAPVVVTLNALGTILEPRMSDGTRSLRYGGAVEAGSALVMDGGAGRVTLNGEDITPYTDGDFPVVLPGASVLTYTDHDTSSHQIDGEVAFRDRWW